MPRILFRYLLRGLVGHWAVLVAMLAVVLTVSQLPQVLDRAANHEIAPDLVLKVLLWMLVANAPALFLVTLLLAVVLFLGRLGADSEVTAMHASGFSTLNMLGAVMIFAVPVIVLQAFISLQFAPQAYCSAVLARAAAVRNLARAPVKAGQFLPLGDSGTLLVDSVDPDGELHRVFANVQGSMGTAVVTADRGRVAFDARNDRVVLELFDGRYYEGTPGERRFRQVRFKEYTKSIPLPITTSNCSRPDTQSTRQLMSSSGNKERSELSQRFSYVTLAIAFALMAVPLSRTRPREGAYARIPAALGLFAVCTFGTSGLASFAARNATGIAVFWAVQAGLIALAIYWIRKRQLGR